MNDKEILGELKNCYEYLYDIIENADSEQLSSEQKEKLKIAKRNIEDIYEEVFEDKNTEHNISIPGAKNLIIAETPSADYYDIEEDIFVSKAEVIINEKEYEWWNDYTFMCNE